MFFIYTHAIQDKSKNIEKSTKATRAFYIPIWSAIGFVYHPRKKVYVMVHVSMYSIMQFQSVDAINIKIFNDIYLLFTFFSSEFYSKYFYSTYLSAKPNKMFEILQYISCIPPHLIV